ncbi:uncharacterized protein PV07_01537 [Cladophialophora immunda]|uniref:N-acetyltransferase domain-containing protein n=1 Tax=Cladophialophora immunda TaxID=569365 RepID=A0A0D2A3B6_9EURO|nr:uncharacterized protein PV07_01537 [Cladophialophora immunda]KIW34781.1 hypothetical protein PV07_01537 [Cladophialophora immunda]OQV06319.1 Acetyltransferase GNAT domain-containing protein [Cladophialophora immunda]
MAHSTVISHLEDGKVEITTERLLLRAAREDDVMGVYEAFSDPEVMRYCTLPHEDPSQTQSRLQEMIDSPTNGTTNFIIALRPDRNHPIGIVGINAPESHEIGFILSRQHWGTGIAQEAVSCVLGYLFGARGMDEVIAEVEPRNRRCVRFLERQGFTESGFTERMWEVGGIWWDSLQLRLKRESWEQRTEPESLNTETGQTR